MSLSFITGRIVNRRDCFQYPRYLAFPQQTMTSIPGMVILVAEWNAQEELVNLQ